MALYPNPPSVFLTTYVPYGLIGLVGQNPQQPNFQLQFSSAATSSQKEFVSQQVQTFDWVPYVAPPGPNVMGFIGAITSDSTINTAAQMGLAAWYPQLQMFINQPSVLKSGWTMLVTEYQSTWLTPTVQTAVLVYASQFHIPLV